MAEHNYLEHVDLGRSPADRRRQLTGVRSRSRSGRVREQLPPRARLKAAESSCKIAVDARDRRALSHLMEDTCQTATIPEDQR